MVKWKRPGANPLTGEQIVLKRACILGIKREFWKNCRHLIKASTFICLEKKFLMSCNLASDIQC